MLDSFFASVGIFLATIFGGQQFDAVAPIHNQPAAAIVALAENDSATRAAPSTGDTPAAGSTQATIVNQYITQPVIERTVQTTAALPGDYVTQSELSGRLADLSNVFARTVFGSTYPAPATSYASGGIMSSVALMGRIENLSGTNLSDIIVDGVSGLTNADIPDDITASSYLPLSGGTITGALTIPYLTATSTTATSSFAGPFSIGSTTPSGTSLFSVGTSSSLLHVDKISGLVGIGAPNPIDGLEVVNNNPGSGVDTFRSVLSLTDGSASAAGVGGGLRFRGVTSFGYTTHAGIWAEQETAGSTSGSLKFMARGTDGLAPDMTITSGGKVGIGSTTPFYRLSVAGVGAFDDHVRSSYFVATSTTATSTFAGGITGPNNFTIQSSSGNVGIGTTSPSATLAAVASADSTDFSFKFINNHSGNSAFDKGVLIVGGGNNNGIPALDVRKHDGTTSMLFVSGSGQVGVSNAEPEAKLHVGYQTDTANAEILVTTQASYNQILRFQPYTGFQFKAGNYGESDGRYFEIRNNADTPVFVIGPNNTGNVGIGTTSPYTALAVAGASGVLANIFTATSTTATSTFAGGLAIETSGLVYDYSTNNVGIGTASPSNQGGYGKTLDITGTTPGLVFHPAGSTNEAGIVSATNGVFFDASGSATASNNMFTFRTSNSNSSYSVTDRLTISSAGLVGIGGTSASKLTVLGGWVSISVGNPFAWNIDGDSKYIASGYAGAINVESADGAMRFYTAPLGTAGNAATSVERLTIGNTGNAGIGTTTPWGKLSVTNTGTGPSFVVEDSTSPDSTPFIIDASGNVGIGTTSPRATLDSAGTISVTGGGTPTTGAGLEIGYGRFANTADFLAYDRSGAAFKNFLFNGLTQQFQISDSEKMRVTSSGLSVGTTASGPSGGVIAAGTIEALGGFYVGNGASNGLYGIETTAAAAPDLRFNNNAGTERMRLTDAGNVGIGTTTPQFPFVVNTSSGSDLTAVLNTASGQQYSGLYLANNTTKKAQFFLDNTNSYVGIGGNASGISTRLLYGAAQTGLTLDSTGTVGIGTTSPASKLTVRNDGPSYTSVASFVDATSNGIPYITIGKNDNSAADSGLALLYDTANNVGGMLIAGDGQPTGLWVKRGGNVGIGTSTPWRTLSVTGTVGFDGLTGTTGAGSLCLDSNKQVVYNSGSDACLSSTRATKHDIQNLDLDALILVKSLQPVSFVYNNDASSTVRYGFIAEDTAGVDTHLATYDANGNISGIDDRSIIAIVVAAIRSFADKFTTKELTFTRATGGELVAKKITGDLICATKSDGTPVCVTGDQLSQIVEQSGQAPAASSPTPSEPDEPQIDDVPLSPSDEAAPTDEATDAENIPEVSDAPPLAPEELPAEISADLPPAVTAEE